MTRAPWSDDDVATIRKAVVTMNDAAIAKQLDWPAWRVLHVRKLFDIPPHHAEFWPKEALDLIHARYVVEGKPASLVAEELKALDMEILEATIRRKALRMNWKRAPDAERRNSNLANARIGEAKRAKRKPKPVPSRAQARPLPGPMLALHNAPVNWSKAIEDPRPLDERILSALKERPLSVMALASVIGVKEHALDIQLAALAHAGGVEAGPAVECGRRNRLWRAAA